MQAIAKMGSFWKVVKLWWSLSPLLQYLSARLESKLPFWIMALLLMFDIRLCCLFGSTRYSALWWMLVGFFKVSQWDIDKISYKILIQKPLGKSHCWFGIYEKLKQLLRFWMPQSELCKMRLGDMWQHLELRIWTQCWSSSLWYSLLFLLRKIWQFHLQ